MLMQSLKLYIVVIGIILSIIGYFLSTAQKHNRQTFEHNRSGPTWGIIAFNVISPCQRGSREFTGLTRFSHLRTC